MATTKATKSKGLKGLIGKQVYIKNRYGSDKKEGPFKLLSVDLPFFEFEDSEYGVFWWNTDIIEGLTECREVAIAAE
jgi:hypothetical protein